MQESSGSALPKPDRLMQWAWGYAPTLIIGAAVQHRLFDHLAANPLGLEALSAKTGASPRGLRAVLNALVALGLLRREALGYALTPESAAFLVSTQPEYRGASFDHHCRQLLPQWLHLPEIVRTGIPHVITNQEDRGEEHFAAFVESLFPLSFAAAKALGTHLGVPDRSGCLSVLDVGAGSGVWGIALAMQSAQVTVFAVDYPKVLEVARRLAQRHGVLDRCTFVPGNFHEVSFGQDHDVAVLGHILHSEGAEGVRNLLRRVFHALRPGGVLAIQEFLPDEDRGGPVQPLVFAVNMLVNTEEGDSYTFGEIAGWLRDAGFETPRLLEVPAVSPLILAQRPGRGSVGNH